MTGLPARNRLLADQVAADEAAGRPGLALVHQVEVGAEAVAQVAG